MVPGKQATGFFPKTRLLNTVSFVLFPLTCDVLLTEQWGRRPSEQAC